MISNPSRFPGTARRPRRGFGATLADRPSKQIYVDRSRRFLPFVSWFPMTRQTVRADLQAGIAVALVLVPQSMAYAQLAGMPAYYGLYAAFLPAIVGALWGSSRQLATGPVAMVSLLTGAALSQFAAPGSEHFIALAIALALMVGVMELAMGALKLGAVVSFLSHPVVVGFTNAAAIIIALSQLSKLLGVASGREENFLAEVWAVLRQAADTHVPTLLMGLAALAIMVALRRYAPAWPSVLIAVAVTTVVSWQTGFERRSEAPVEAIVDSEIRLLARDYSGATAQIGRLGEQLAEKAAELKVLDQARDRDRQHILALRYEVEVLRLAMRDAERENRVRARALRKFVFERATGAAGPMLYSADSLPAGSETD